MLRLFLVPLALLLLLILAAALLIPMLLDQDKVLQLANAALQEKTGATLSVAGEAKLSLLPTLGIALSDAAVNLPEKYQAEVRVRKLDIGVQLLPLLSRHIEMETVNLDGLEVRIESARSESTAVTGQPDLTAGAGAALAIPLALDVKKLSVTDSRVEWIDSAGKSSVVELAKVQVDGLNFEQKPVRLDVQVGLPRKQRVDVALSGNIRIDQLTQTITLDEVATQVSGATPQPAKIQASGTVDLAKQVAQLQLALELGDTHGKGRLRYATQESPRLDTALQLNQFDPALLLLAGPKALSAAGSQEAPENADEPLPLDALRYVDAHAVLDIEQARLGAQTVKALHVDLLAIHGVVKITELTGDLHGGKLQATATLDGREALATLDSSGSVTRVDLATALAAAKAKPVLTGGANLTWQLHGQGRSQNELTTALSGPVKLTTQDVVLQGTSVEKLLCQTVALSNQEQLTATFPADTRFTNFSADVQVADGKARLEPLNAAVTGITLSGSGNYDLLERDFEATFKARLSPELEQLDHACRVSKRLVAIDWPVDCKGSVGTEPGKWCRVDAEKILRDMAVNEGKSKLEKKASKLLDKLFNKD